MSESSVTEALGVTIDDACRITGLSRSKLYSEFLTPGRVKPIQTGKRDRIILLAELRAAFDKYVAEKRAAGAVGVVARGSGE